MGDNPGKTEFEEKKFFIGTSGQSLRNHFLDNEICSDFDSKCMIFNKTFIHTHKTKDLEPIKEKIGEKLFNQILISYANEVAEISNKFNLPILIFGKTKLGHLELFETYWKTITEEVANKNQILVFNHPAYGHFSREWNSYKKN